MKDKKKRDIPSSLLHETIQRAVFLPFVIVSDSDINRGTYAELAPQIIKYRLVSNEPIFLYIHCIGGDPIEAEHILRLIRAPKQDGERCELTTVCTGIAASAAADLLSAGDYAIAYSDSLIHVHGTRDTSGEVTVDNLEQIESSLRQGNEYFAMKLASKMFRRFATQSLLLEAFKTSPPLPNVIGVAVNPKSILSVIGKNVAQEHKELVKQAVDRVERITKLYEFVTIKLKSSNSEPISAESDLLKMIVDFEASDLLERKKAGEDITGFTRNAFSGIYEDFIGIKELLSGSYIAQAIEWCHLKGHYFLTIDEVKEFKQIVDVDPTKREAFLEEKTATRVFPLWYLVISLCRLLQKGENEFTAHDAWYFGLIDEVVGSDLPSIRKWRELRGPRKPPSPSSTPSGAASATAPVPPSEQLPPSDDQTKKRP